MGNGLVASGDPARRDAAWRAAMANAASPIATNVSVPAVPQSHTTS
ncbi:MAG: hypothetical protein K0S49_599 [Microbacterium sp.]|nr:hypothetical protein [Microbacterium sp.]